MAGPSLDPPFEVTAGLSTPPSYGCYHGFDEVPLMLDISHSKGPVDKVLFLSRGVN